MKNIYTNFMIRVRSDLRESLPGMFIFTIAGLIFWYFYSRQEDRITKKLEECCIVTLIEPIRMPDTHKLYFKYRLNNQKYESSNSVGSEDLGMLYSRSKILNMRFFVKIYCQDYSVNRVQWDIPVPDTLQFIPVNGWTSIPYDLEKSRKIPFEIFPSNATTSKKNSRSWWDELIHP
jgi:hypothetical protein